jgi:hypothetical protein
MKTFAIAAVLAAVTLPAAGRDIHMIWMGGNDCPPCKAWRMAELPKLQQSAEFKAIKFSYVEKLISSPVPPSIFLPAEVKPYKDQLDTASGGAVGSPQAAIVVDGKVYDYFHNARKAEDVEKMIASIRTGGKYPFKRCLKYAARSRTKCEVPA